MIKVDAFLDPARGRGFDFYTGVPCSFLTSTINRVIGATELDYVGAASEGEAVAIASGAWLAGRRTVVMCQNSGLGNAVNPLTSLNYPFRIPTLMIVTWRGQPGLKDEPQHALMGPITPSLLDVIQVPHRPFPTVEADVSAALDAAEAAMSETGLPFALIMEKGSVEEESLDQTPLIPRPRGPHADLSLGGARPERIRILERLLDDVPEDAGIVASTGKCGRELFTLDDRAQNLYQVGSMGCASGMGLGIAVNSDRPIVVLDGDGAALMKLGSMATIGAHQPENLIHVILDNGVHDSTGGQATVSEIVSFAEVALACGYSGAASCDSVDGFADAFAGALETPGPHLIHARIAPGSLQDLGRPTVTPAEVARRFKAFLAG